MKRESSVKRRRGAAAASAAAAEDDMHAGAELAAEEPTVKDKWLKLYRDKYRAVDEARFRAIQVL